MLNFVPDPLSHFEKYNNVNGTAKKVRFNGLGMMLQGHLVVVCCLSSSAADSPALSLVTSP